MLVEFFEARSRYGGFVYVSGFKKEKKRKEKKKKALIVKARVRVLGA